jgi:hypothetical protein
LFFETSHPLTVDCFSHKIRRRSCTRAICSLLTSVRLITALAKTTTSSRIIEALEYRLKHDDRGSRAPEEAVGGTVTRNMIWNDHGSSPFNSTKTDEQIALSTCGTSIFRSMWWRDPGSLEFVQFEDVKKAISLINYIFRHDKGVA